MCLVKNLPVTEFMTIPFAILIKHGNVVEMNNRFPFIHGGLPYRGKTSLGNN